MMKSVLTFSDKIILFPLWLLSLMPLRLLYIFSDFLYILIYYIARYRRNVVFQNIKNSFPEKNNKEIKSLIHKFYRYLCDYFIESIYMINMSIEECNERYSYANAEIIERLYKQNRSIILATSHYGNWEWASNLCTVIHHDILGIYKHLSNHLFDKLYIEIRGKYGSFPVLMKHTLRVINEYTKKGELFALYLVGDQRPIPEDLNYWTTFLNQETPIITGTEKLSKKFNLAVVFLDIDRLKRGYYRITFNLLTDEPRKEVNNAITKKYIRKVEQMIIKRPEFWLWSHKRWKYNPKTYKQIDLD